MARNKRKVYGESTERTDGIPCTECGCCHNYVVRTEKIGATIRRTRRCRNCGRTFYTVESS